MGKQVYEVIFDHISDSSPSVVYQGTKTNCRRDIASRKRTAKRFHGRDQVEAWGNEGFSVKGMYRIELAISPEESNK